MVQLKITSKSNLEFWILRSCALLGHCFKTQTLILNHCFRKKRARGVKMPAAVFLLVRTPFYCMVKSRSFWSLSKQFNRASLPLCGKGFYGQMVSEPVMHIALAVCYVWALYIIQQGKSCFNEAYTRGYRWHFMISQDDWYGKREESLPSGSEQPTPWWGSSRAPGSPSPLCQLTAKRYYQQSILAHIIIDHTL